MSQGDMGLLEYIAALERQEEEKKRELEEIRIAKAHALRVIDEGGMKRATLPGTKSGQAKTEGSPKENGGPYSGMGNEEAALKFVNSADRTVKTAHVRDGLKAGGIDSEAKDFHSTIFSSLSRLADKGLIEKRGPGKWGPKEEEEEEMEEVTKSESENGDQSFFSSS